MSRIGNKLIAIPSGVKVSLDGNVVTVEGKSKLSLNLPELVSVAIDAESIKVSAADDSRRASSILKLTRSTELCNQRPQWSTLSCIRSSLRLPCS